MLDEAAFLCLALPYFTILYYTILYILYFILGWSGWATSVLLPRWLLTGCLLVCSPAASLLSHRLLLLLLSCRCSVNGLHKCRAPHMYAAL
ncbi:hypothetical protein FN846DRAFT_926923 [Sphaerosporella brunnea]|uniref:Uncharacterized protein n=1 Tax=Sphaerosporella brunnea TaxID=1250544 RepID=A0A5J5FAF8_9PEZI|nr:hypothetical protein FN846DRAFT_926923 [Sphaerosporella brunnea]